MPLLWPCPYGKGWFIQRWLDNFIYFFHPPCGVRGVRKKKLGLLLLLKVLQLSWCECSCLTEPQLLLAQNRLFLSTLLCCHKLSAPLERG